MFLTPTYKPAYVYGGVIVVTSLLAEALAKNGHEVIVYTTNGNGVADLKVETGTEINVDGVKVFYFKRFTRGHSNISPAFWRKINSNVKNFDIVHLHSWWNPTIIIAAAICKMQGIRPILSPHGMLCEYILETNNKRIKQLLHYLFGKSLLQNTFLHVSSEMEWNESQKIVGGDWPGANIFNLVELKHSIPATIKTDNAPFVIGFLSRIDPKKRIDLLIKALSKVSYNYRLKIAGNGDCRYVRYLKNLSIEYGNSHKIDWVGWKDNLEKYEFYSSIDLFALLSFNENFGVVVIEALSVGTPVFLSSQVGLSDFVEQRSLGWIINENQTEKVVETLELIYKDRDKCFEIKSMAPSIIQKDFNSYLLTNEYLEFYSKVKGMSVEKCNSI
ncbi:MAG TPA: glycosyltransferase [Flavobacterium sp.]